MVLSVNSSTKVVLGFGGAAVALALVTVLFYRFRGNTSAHPTAASLAKKDVSILRNIPLIGSAINYFCPIKTTKKPIESIGSSAYRILSLASLTKELASAKQRYQAIDTLIICGDNLQITKDPGILDLDPIKVILRGVQIVMSFDTDSLTQLMVNRGWQKNSLDELNIIEVASVEEAVQADLPVNPETSKPVPTVYSVRV
jgi:hypothetical protein